MSQTIWQLTAMGESSLRAVKAVTHVSDKVTTERRQQPTARRASDNNRVQRVLCLLSANLSHTASRLCNLLRAVCSLP